MDADVVVVGAGAAGLAAARALTDAGRAAVVLEARPVPGGRIRTLHPPGLPGAVELGAEFVHGDAPATRRWLAAGGSAVEPMWPGDDADGDGEDADEDADDAPWSWLGQALAALDPGPDPDRDQSVDAALARVVPPRAASLLRGYLTGYDALDPERASARAVVEEEGDDPGGSALRSVRAPAGQDRIVLGLLTAGPPLDLRTRHRVLRVEHGGDRVVVEAIGPLGRPVELAASRAVIALPIGVLHGGAVAFDPPLAAPLGAVAAGAAIRATLAFSPELFAERLAGLGFRTGGRGQFPTFWTAAGGAPAVVAWAGGPGARELSARTPLERIGQAVSDLAAELGLPASLLEANLRGWYHHDWVSDPLSLGAYSYVTVGGARARTALGEPYGRLIFAGEHVPTPGVTSSTVEAALRSGERAARSLLASWGSGPQAHRS